MKMKSATSSMWLISATMVENVSLFDRVKTVQQQALPSIPSATRFWFHDTGPHSSRKFTSFNLSDEKMPACGPHRK
jgi:hypothetical protein